MMLGRKGLPEPGDRGGEWLIQRGEHPLGQAARGEFVLGQQLLQVVHVPDVARHSDGRGYTDRVRAARSDLELFDAFLSHVRDGEGLTEREREVLRDVLEERVVVEALA